MNDQPRTQCESQPVNQRSRSNDIGVSKVLHPSPTLGMRCWWPQGHPRTTASAMSLQLSALFDVKFGDFSAILLSWNQRVFYDAVLDEILEDGSGHGRRHPGDVKRKTSSYGLRQGIENGRLPPSARKFCGYRTLKMVPVMMVIICRNWLFAEERMNSPLSHLQIKKGSAPVYSTHIRTTSSDNQHAN